MRLGWYGLLLLLAFQAVGGPPPAVQAQPYDVPNNDADCPANCRQIPWKAGADLWNGGVLPTYTAVPCTGLTEGNGTTDNTSTIQACLNALSASQATLLPPGMYYVNGTVTVPLFTALRGAGSTNCTQGTWLSATFHGDTGTGATCTTLKLGTSGGLRTAGADVLGSPVALTSGYTKGSTALVTASAPGLAVGDFLMVAQQQGDTAIPVSWTGEDGDCTWCGEANNTGYLMTQIVQVASVSGTTVGLTRPLYYTFTAALSPRLRRVGAGAQKVGIESLKLWGSTTARTGPHIAVDGCMYCWVRDVETYNTPDVAKAYPIFMQYAYGNEIRDSYFHFGQGNSGDRNYGIGFFGPNSDHKVENNIYRENRHSFSQEGGGSGLVFLYNYIDDNYTDDLSYLGSPRANHGAHPYMTLFEGNIISHFVADHYWGTSSHMVLFRNWLWGDETGNFVGFDSTHPSFGFTALDIAAGQHYYSVVGNVLGNTSLHTTWANATLATTDCNQATSRTSPRVFSIGCDSIGNPPYDATVRASTILHGNYDYKTTGVAVWDGGSNHTLKSSMYYATKPAFFGSAAWPTFGPDLAPVAGTIPAKTRFDTGGVPPALHLAAPTNFRVLP